MAKAQLKQGAVLDGFLLESLIHKGGMARLWRVSRANLPMPLVMKVPILGEGEDPAAIVGFEMEQMILPRLARRAGNRPPGKAKPNCARSPERSRRRVRRKQLAISCICS